MSSAAWLRRCLSKTRREASPKHQRTTNINHQQHLGSTDVKLLRPRAAGGGRRGQHWWQTMRVDSTTPRAGRRRRDIRKEHSVPYQLLVMLVVAALVAPAGSVACSDLYIAQVHGMPSASPVAFGPSSHTPSPLLLPSFSHPSPSTIWSSSRVRCAAQSRRSTARPSSRPRVDPTTQPLCRALHGRVWCATASRTRLQQQPVPTPASPGCSATAGRCSLLFLILVVELNAGSSSSRLHFLSPTAGTTAWPMLSATKHFPAPTRVSLVCADPTYLLRC